MKRCFFLLIIFSSLSVIAQDKKPEDYKFDELVQAGELVFTMPKGFRETPVIPNESHPYQYAVRDTVSGFEARYYVKPYKLAGMSADPDLYSQFAGVVLSLSGNDVSNVPDVMTFDAADLKKESGADRGWYSIMRLKSKFAPGYSFCSVSVVQKSGIGEFYIFKLFNTIDRRTEWLLQDVVDSLRFK